MFETDEVPQYKRESGGGEGTDDSVWSEQPGVVWSTVYSPWLTVDDPWMPQSLHGFEGSAWMLLPWWLRLEQTGNGTRRKDFVQAYPLALPYFALPAFDPMWVDPWSMQPYHNVWWG